MEALCFGALYFRKPGATENPGGAPYFFGTKLTFKMKINNGEENLKKQGSL